MINDELKLKVIKIYLWIVGIFLFFWWPLSHWFFSDLYHILLGFPKSSYMVKTIGTLGIIPVLMSILSAINPIKNKNMVIILIIFSFLLAITYIFLIITNQFPKLEYINVMISLFSSIFLSVFYPWNVNLKSK